MDKFEIIGVIRGHTMISHNEEPFCHIEIIDLNMRDKDEHTTNENVIFSEENKGSFSPYWYQFIIREKVEEGNYQRVMNAAYQWWLPIKKREWEGSE